MFGRKKKQKVDDTPSKINTNEVVIKVGVSHGGDVRHVKDTFIAREEKDGFGGLEFVEEKREFREDVNFEKEDLYNEMVILLELKDKDINEQLRELEKRIDKQKKLLSYLDKHIELNGTFNYADEALKQKDLLILYNHIKTIDEKRGAFYELDEKGRRVYTFMKKDGFLYPVWHGSNNFSNYPDYTRKKKIFNSEKAIFENEWGKYWENRINVSSILILSITFLILLIANMYGGYKLYEKHNDLDNQIHGAAYQCAEYTSQVNEEITKFLSNEIVQSKIKQTDEEYNILKQQEREKVIDLTQ